MLEITRVEGNNCQITETPNSKITLRRGNLLSLFTRIFYI